MSARVSATRTPLRFDEHQLESTLARICTLATMMDSRFTLPGSNVRVGLDAVIGLIPVVGDVAGQLVSIYLITQARRLGAPNALIARMIANTMLDAALGCIPVVGDVFDAWFKVNVRNLDLLHRHLERNGLMRR